MASNERVNVKIEASSITAVVTTSDQLCAAMIGERVRVTTSDAEVAGILSGLSFSSEITTVGSLQTRVERSTFSLRGYVATVGGHRLRLSGKEKVEVLT